jgi:excisionase family DNA binding protein
MCYLIIMSTAHDQNNTKRHQEATKIGVDRSILTVDDALHLLDGAVGRSTLYKALKLGLLPHKRLGRRILISRARLMQWLNDDCHPQPSEAAEVGHARRG